MLSNRIVSSVNKIIWTLILERLILARYINSKKNKGYDVNKIIHWKIIGKWFQCQQNR